MSKYEKIIYMTMLVEQFNRFEYMFEFLEDMLKSHVIDHNID